jgi:hypothetical protein
MPGNRADAYKKRRKQPFFGCFRLVDMFFCYNFPYFADILTTFFLTAYKLKGPQ